MAKKRQLTFCDQIRDAVEASELSRYRIAKKTGIDAGLLCKFVKGQSGLSVESLDKLAECIGLAVVVTGKLKSAEK